MSIDNPQVIDFVGIDKNSDECVLTVSDHFDWDIEEHLEALQSKLNAYLRFIESGQIYEDFGKAAGRELRIHVALKFDPSEVGAASLSEASKVVENAGYSLTWGLLQGEA